MDPKLEYLYKLLGVYHMKGAGEFINSKISAINGKENPFFCNKCSRTFILKSNCTAKLQEDNLTIDCNGCGSITQLMITDSVLEK
ncbi:hypothetical protein GINT2_001017 [Glugoides intestinalis]